MNARIGLAFVYFIFTFSADIAFITFTFVSLAVIIDAFAIIFTWIKSTVVDVPVTFATNIARITVTFEAFYTVHTFAVFTANPRIVSTFIFIITAIATSPVICALALSFTLYINETCSAVFAGISFARIHFFPTEVTRITIVTFATWFTSVVAHLWLTTSWLRT